MRKILITLTALALFASHVAASGFLINPYSVVPGCTGGALTISDLGNGNSSSSGATVATGSTITASTGDWLVAIVAADNNGTNGATSLSSVTDSSSNSWTQRALANQDPGAAAAGATLGIFTAPITSAPSSGTVTANFSPATTSKAIQVYRVQPPAGCAVIYIDADATGTTGASAASATTTVSVIINDTIFGAVAIETGTPGPSGDADSTNGSWSSALIRAGNTGTNATSMVNLSQYKTATATGNQTHNSTFSSTDWAASYLILGAR